MKQQALYVIAALTLVTAAAATRVYGQQIYAAQFDVPFDFTVRGERFPAGTYIVQRFDSGSSLIRGTEGAAFFPTIPTKERVAPEQSRLVFRKYGDHYCLREVWSAGLATGRELPMTRTEKRLQRELEARGTEAKQTVLVASN